MRWFGIFLAGALLVLGSAYWVHSGLAEAREAVGDFCLTLRGGELWAPAVERARAQARELVFQRVSRTGASPEELQAERDAFGQRFACTVEVEQGHVIRARTSELPRD